MGFASLGSGSRGNGTLVALEGGRGGRGALFLVDCGFTIKQTEARLKRLGVSAGDIDAIFVSHEHSDHIAGVAGLSHKYALPVFASFGTARRLDLRCQTFDGDVPFEVDGVTVNPVRVPHDACEPTQFVFSDGRETIGVLSDLGCVTQHVIEQYSGLSHLLMEANHDVEMLKTGRYPPQLKRRVGEDFGHLSNDQAYALLDRIGHEALDVVIGHVSEQNNCAQILERVFEPLRGRVGSLDFATQGDGVSWLGHRPVSRQASFSEA